VSPTIAAYGSTSDTKISLNRNDTGNQHVSNVAAEGGISLEVTLFNQTATGHRSSLIFRGTVPLTPTGQGGIWGGSGTRLAAQDTDAIRFLFSSGDIAAAPSF
jgi:hypothetical protein